VPSPAANPESAAEAPRVRHPGDDLVTLPKVELHVHLEGSIDAVTAAALAEAHGQDPAEVLALEDGAYPRRFRDFDHFVSTFLATSGLVRTPDDLATVAAAFARGQAAQRVVWTEATFTALTLARQGMEPREMFRALADGFSEAPDVRIGVVVDSIRNLGVDASHETLRLVEEFGDEAPIVGLGLTGIEGSVPERDFVHLREAATRLGLGFAVHAGETGPPEVVRAALDDLGADRIGHGISAVRDRDLLERIVRDQVPLEVCPSSNVTLSLVERLDDHPLVELWEAGANVTISSDDPPFFSTTLTDELDHARRLCALERRELAELQRRAARAAFAPPEVTAEALGRIDAWATGSAI
jgi:aminodeoxyfutalosine deaminase